MITAATIAGAGQGMERLEHPPKSGYAKRLVACWKECIGDRRDMILQAARRHGSFQAYLRYSTEPSRLRHEYHSGHEWVRNNLDEAVQILAGILGLY